MNDFEYGRQLLAALVPLALTVIVHGLGMDVVRRNFERFGKPLLRKSHNAAARTVFMISVVGIMVLTHFAGIVVWAIAFLSLDIVPGVEQAVFYSMQYYTTLGANVHKLPEGWQGFGGFEAMTGMLMFGWSTAVLALVGQKMHSIDD
ncbi:MAG: hypothetical protein IPJ27_07815 [Candidatus Accumulibacter sp.]|uniref:Two pore domain potassium channel family protein n=1 Tax=Candidatus Accumulibacter proximus TaxID=2954385 RepID=A0A935PY72_9PROT|nr:hypothetical protein [Candidatus Accumulibacter proximus]